MQQRGADQRGVLVANAREKREEKPYHGFTRMSAKQKRTGTAWISRAVCRKVGVRRETNFPGAKLLLEARGARISRGVLAANAREKREEKPYRGFTRMSADQKRTGTAWISRAVCRRVGVRRETNFQELSCFWKQEPFQGVAQFLFIARFHQKIFGPKIVAERLRKIVSMFCPDQNGNLL